MAKLENDKYYTPDDLVDFCLSQMKKVLLEDGIIPSRIIEPSAGNGAFSKKIKGCVAYDIHPQNDNIIEQDFLKIDLEYQKGTVIIGNPPFGRCLSLAQKFYKKSIQIADYIGFILPISQLDNNRTFYEFDLIKSIDLGIRNYSGVNLHCCFNIYKRPISNEFNKKNLDNLSCVKIIRQDQKNYQLEKFDIRMCYWGNGSAGKILNNLDETYSGEYKIQVDDLFKTQVVEVLNNVNWKERLKKIAMLRIKKYDIIELLKEKIPNIY